MPDWDKRYRRGEQVKSEPSHLLVKATEALPPGRALDLACGAGRHTIYLAGLGWRVTAVDASREGLRIAERRASELGLQIETHAADLERGEFVIEAEAYDLICVFYYLQRDLFPGIRTGVRAGGTVVAAIHIIDEDRESGPGNRLFSLNPGELKTEFPGWEISHYREGQPQDREHKRRTAQIVARKPRLSQGCPGNTAR